MLKLKPFKFLSIITVTILFLSILLPSNIILADDIKLNPSQMSKGEYIQWKSEQMRKETSSRIRAFASSGWISNEYIEAYTNSSGHFTLGTTGGRPNSSQDDYKNMLYGHPNPWSSFTTVRINNSNYIFNPNLQSPATSDDGLSCTAIQEVDGVSIQQVLTLVENPNTGRKDTVEIKYIIANTSSETKSAGVRIMLDTMLGDNDGAPFKIPGIGNCFTEMEFEGNNIPQSWQAFDNINTPNVITDGTFYYNVANRPDKVQFAFWGDIYNSMWDYSITAGKNLTGDSSVAVYYNPTSLAPSEKRTVTTYYGLNDFAAQDLQPPLAIGIFAPQQLNLNSTEKDYNPNPFIVTAYIENIGSATAINSKVKINLPDGLSLASGSTEVPLGNLIVGQSKQVSWNVKAKPQNIQNTLNYSIYCTADNTEAKNVHLSIKLPAVKVNKAIIVIPGICGSELIDTDLVSSPASRYILWLNPLSDLKNLQCNQSGESLNNAILPFNDDSNNNYGVMNTYGALVNALKSSFSDEYDVQFFPYDWRLTNTKSAELLEKFIEFKGYGKVILVAHSMGGLVSSEYIKKPENKSKIEKIITLGTPYLGSPKSLYMFETGNFLDGITGLVGNPLIRDDLKLIIQNFASVYELLPPSQYFSFNNTYYVTKRQEKSGMFNDIITKLTNYSDTTDLLSQRSWAKQKDFLNNAQVFHNGLYTQNSNPIINSVNSYFIIGYNQGTIAEMRLRYNAAGNFKKIEDIDKLNGGDGTVPVISANIGNKIPSARSFYIKEEHGNLPKNSDVIELVKNIINNKDSNVNESSIQHNDKITHTLPSPSFLGWGKIKLKIECPVDISIVKDGNVLGSIINNFPNQGSTELASLYTVGDNNDTKIVFLNTDNCDVKMQGTANGKMTYTLECLNEDGDITRTLRFDNVPITPTTKITTDTKINGGIKLNVDTNNDGNIDFILNPSYDSNTVYVSGLSLNKANISLKVGETFALNSTVLPSNATNKAVSWSTSSSSIAAVDSNGVVTAKGTGTATITVSSQDGNKTATCIVTVANDIISNSYLPKTGGFGNLYYIIGLFFISLGLLIIAIDRFKRKFN